MSEPFTCSYCGALRSMNARFCKNCGRPFVARRVQPPRAVAPTPVTNPVTPPPVQAAPAQAPSVAVTATPPAARRKLLYAAATLLMLMGLGGASFMGWGWLKAATDKNADEPAWTLRSSCVLYNDDQSQPTVNVRADCDKKSCDGDSSTIISEYPNDTEVRINREVKVRAKKDYYWMQLVLVGSGKTAWASSAKIRCNGEQLKLLP